MLLRETTFMGSDGDFLSLCTRYGKVELLFIVVWLLSVVWLPIITNVCIELLLWHGEEMYGKILGAF